MAFDGGMVRACVWEMQALIGAKIEKVLMPQGDELVLLLHTKNGTERLSVFASASTPRINITKISKENPKVPPSVCMQLRKHLTGAKITEITQPGLERMVQIGLSSYDELGFPETKQLIIEIMGKYSNAVLISEKGKIIAALKTVDFTESRKRQLIPGMTYEAPPSQDKKNPLEETEAGFFSAAESYIGRNFPAGKYFCAVYTGISPLISRELAYLALGSADMEISAEAVKALYKIFFQFRQRLLQNEWVPTIVYDEENKPIEYSFMPLAQYGAAFSLWQPESIGALIDLFYAEKEQADRIRTRAQDVIRLLTTAKNRLIKKIAAQQEELRLCTEKDRYKHCGDLITANLYALKKGMSTAVVIDYTQQPAQKVELSLDSTLTPSQNAQKLYKKYTKMKTAEKELAKQLALSEKELAYIDTVLESLSRAETENDILEIREELYNSGYASKMKNYKSRRPEKSKPLTFCTRGGYRVYIGKNNFQNDFLTLKQADKQDYWFHVKNAPGSHVILITGGEEPPSEEFTQAAAAAAYYSSLRDGKNVEVDYTQIKNIKKPAGAKPGFVIYHTNYSAVVTPEKPEGL